MAPLPDWLHPLPDAGEQRALDEWAIGERGIPGLGLMERAGTGLADLVGELAPAGRVVVVCGKGNNGGDGLVSARVLRSRAVPASPSASSPTASASTPPRGRGLGSTSRRASAPRRP